MVAPAAFSQELLKKLATTGIPVEHATADTIAPSDAISVKEDWGHSSNMVAVELAQMARVKHLVLFHHEPIYDDQMIENILAETRRYAEISAPRTGLKITAAYDGLEIAL